jgi:hypothetical protein
MASRVVYKLFLRKPMSKKSLNLTLLTLLSVSTFNGMFISQASAGEVTTTIVSQRSEAGFVTGLVESAEKLGWQWRWSTESGRRDVAQIFRAPRNFTLDKIAVRIDSGASPAVSGSAFNLSIVSFENAKSRTPSQTLATHEGKLPDNKTGQTYRGGDWLQFDVPDISLQDGRYYGFVMGFKEAKTGAQGVVFSLSKNAFPDGQALFSENGTDWKSQFNFQFEVLSPVDTVPVATTGVPPGVAGRVLEVDRGGTTAYKTIKAAVAAAKAGDTIRLKPNSGPYREELYVPVSGTKESPITIDGGGNLITGFEPLTGWKQVNGEWTCTLPVAFPCVLTYKGERVRQDANGQFTRWITLNDAKDTLTLKDGATPEGWEVSTRSFVVRIQNTSNHIYRNIRASGSMNDGFNLHGKGEGLVFENIEGFHNLDEGYSAHDDIQSEVNGGKFWGNDNGIGNVARSQTKFKNIDVWDNLGFGFWLNQCKASMQNIRAWNNGVVQILIHNSQGDAENVRAYTPEHKTRIWTSYKESKSSSIGRPLIVKDSNLTGLELQLESAKQP